MKTLNQETTRTFFKNSGGFHDLNQVASDIGVTRKQLTPAQFLVMNAIRGKDWTKSFTIMTNVIKLANGNIADSALPKAIVEVQCMAFFADTNQPTEDERNALKEFLAPFKGTVTKASLLKLADLLPRLEDCIKVEKVMNKKTGEFDRERIVGIIKPDAFREMAVA